MNYDRLTTGLLRLGPTLMIQKKSFGVAFCY